MRIFKICLWVVATFVAILTVNGILLIVGKWGLKGWIKAGLTY